MLSACKWPCGPPKREHGRRRARREPEIFWFCGRTGEVLDGDWMGRCVLRIVESGNANDPVAIRASSIAAEGRRELLQRQLLHGKVEAFDRPENLVLAWRSSDECAWFGHPTRGAERSDARISIRVDIEVEMSDFRDAF